MSRASQVLAAAVAVAFSGLPSPAAAQNKLVAPVHGEDKIEITKPASKPVGKDVLTTAVTTDLDGADMYSIMAVLAAVCNYNPVIFLKYPPVYLFSGIGITEDDPPQSKVDSPRE